MHKRDLIEKIKYLLVVILYELTNLADIHNNIKLGYIIHFIKWTVFVKTSKLTYLTKCIKIDI